MFLESLPTSGGYLFTIPGRISTVWIPGNRREHFLCRWDLILLGDFFYCFINKGCECRQTIPNNPQRKSSVFIQLALMTVLMLPCVAFIIAHNVHKDLDILGRKPLQVRVSGFHTVCLEI